MATYENYTTDVGVNSSASLTKPSGLQNDDVLILAVNIEETSPSITWPSGFTQIQSRNGSDHHLAVATKHVSNAAGEPSSYSPSWGSQYYTAFLGVIRGLDATDHIDVHAAANGNSTNINCPSVTTTGDNYPVLCIYANYYWDAQTHPSGTTRWGSVDTTAVFGDEGVEIAYFTKATAGATGTKTATLGTARDWTAMQIALIPAVTAVQVDITPAEIELQGQQFTITAVPLAQTVDINPADVELQGQPFTIDSQYPAQQVDINPAEIELQGQPFTIDSQYPGQNVSINPAEIELQGQPFTVDAPVTIPISPANVELQGQQFTITAVPPAQTVDINPADVELQGQPFTINADSQVNINPADVELQGQPFTITANVQIDITPAQIELQGQPFTVETGQVVTINKTEIVLQGKQFTVTAESQDKTVDINPAEIELQGQQFTITAAGSGQIVTINPATIELNPRRFIVETVGGPALIGHAVPLSLSVTSLNQTDDGNGTHEHEVISNSNPGTNESLLATDATGKLLLEKFGASRIVSDLIPDQTDTFDLGSSTSLWRKGWLSELDTILFAENTITLLGGWFYVTKDAGALAEDVDAIQTTIDFGKTMTAGDFVVLRQSLQVEYLTIGTLVSGTTYNVTRNVDGSGANSWVTGSPFAVFGQTGDGRIEFNAYDTPRIQLLRQGATYNTQTEMIRIGDLDQNWGYTAETWGIAIGEYDANKGHLTYDPTNGLRLRVGSNTFIQMHNDGSATIEGALTLGANGGIWQGSGSFASPTTGLKLWNVSGVGRFAGYNSGILQAEFATDGKIKAGQNAVVLDADGVSIEAGSGEHNYLKWVDTPNNYTTVRILGSSTPSGADRYGTLGLRAYKNDGTIAASMLLDGPSGEIKFYHKIAAQSGVPIVFLDTLKSEKGGTKYDVYGYHPIARKTVTGWYNDTKTTGNYTLTTTNLGIPANAKAIYARFSGRCGTVGAYMGAGPSATGWDQLVVNIPVANVDSGQTGYINIESGSIRISVFTATFTGVYLIIYGYLI